MKKILFTVLCLLGMASVSMAQDIRFGLKGGLNAANVTGDEGRDNRFGGYYGLSLHMPLTHSIAFQPELLHSMQGYKRYITGGERTYKMDYLNIPLMFKFYITEGLNIQAGPQIGFLLNARRHDDYGNSTNTEKVTNRYKDMDFGLNFGLGYESRQGLFVEARYNLGLTNNLRNAEDYEDPSFNNRVFQVGLGYRF